MNINKIFFIIGVELYKFFIFPAKQLFQRPRLPNLPIYSYAHGRISYIYFHPDPVYSFSCGCGNADDDAISLQV